MSRLKQIYLILALSSIFIASNVLSKDHQNLKSEKPELIAVLAPLIKADSSPLKNYGLIDFIRSKNKKKLSQFDALSLFIQERVAYGFHDRGYEIYSYKKLNQLVKNQGASIKLDGRFKKNNIDALAKIIVKKWDASRLMTQNELYVEMDISLISVKTGELLWQGTNSSTRIQLQKNIVRPDLSEHFDRAVRSALRDLPKFSKL
jgi:hypothetical protein